MKRKEIFVDKEQMYALTKDKKGTYYLEVVCGGIAMENVIVILSDEEVLSYQTEGKTVLDDLSWEICKDRKKFKNRIVDE